MGPILCLPAKGTGALEACAVNTDPFRVRRYIPLSYLSLSSSRDRPYPAMTALFRPNLKARM